MRLDRGQPLSLVLLTFLLYQILGSFTTSFYLCKPGNVK
nr:MAG TPA: hypothetical protein [Caudoviricetes sp.]